MHCPFCSHDDTRVIDFRLLGEGDQIRRRRECMACKARFTTYETAELTLPRIVKSDGRRETFHEEKLRGGILKALEKRPVAMEQVEAAITRIKRRIRTLCLGVSQFQGPQRIPRSDRQHRAGLESLDA